MKTQKMLTCMVLILAMMLYAVSVVALEAQTTWPDPEIEKAIDLGFVPENLRKNYDTQISYEQFCDVLDGFISAVFPDAISAWESISANYRNADVPMSRMEGAIVMLYAAKCCGIDAVGYEYNIPLEDYLAEGVDFFENVTWDYPLLPDIYEPYYNETLAGSTHYSWRCGMDHVDNAIRFVEYFSYANGKTFFDYDERYSLNLGNAFTRGDAIRAIERLYENARFALYIPADETACTVSAEAIAAGELMPTVSWQQLPEWRGYTVAPGNWAATYGAPMLYEEELIAVLAGQGFNFVRVPLDSRMIFHGADMSRVNPAYLRNMDNLIEYCAKAGIHVCFDLHDMPGFYTGGDDSQITLWYDGETQQIFEDFWRFFAEYYREIPVNLLSFNLLNEPHNMEDSLSDEVYSAVMMRGIDAIRESTPDRLIFADTLGVVLGKPVWGLADAQVVQSVHAYFLSDGTAQWPAYTIGEFVHRENGTLTLNGAFPAGTKVVFTIVSVHGNSMFRVEADGETVAEMSLGTEAIGENGCFEIGEPETDGEFRNYEGVFFETELPKDCNRIQLVQEEGWWYCLNSLSLETDAYEIAIAANGNIVQDQTAPTLVIDENGAAVTQKGTMEVQSKEWLVRVFQNYRDFTVETGTPFMVQEFGFARSIDYQATLAATDDFLSVLNEYEIPWCSWNSDMSPLLDNREYEWSFYNPWNKMSLKRDEAGYEMISENWLMDTKWMDVYQKYMK